MVIGGTSNAVSEITIATSTSGVGELNFTDTANTTNQGGLTYTHSNNNLAFATNGGTGMTLGGSGDLYISGDASNAFMTTGLTIDQGANDNEILAFKSSDVAHGMTALTETDTYGVLKKYNATDGGIGLYSYSEGGIGLYIKSGAASGDTTDTTGSFASMYLNGDKKSGTGTTSVASNENVLMVATNGVGRMLVKGNGDIHAVNTTITALDAYDDVAMCRAHDMVLGHKGVIQNKWDEYVGYNKESLIEAGILGYVSPEEEAEGVQGLTNISQLQRLHNGAIWQLHTRQQDYVEHIEAELTELKASMRLLQEKN
jgi:hypothetical protein